MFHSVIELISTPKCLRWSVCTAPCEKEWHIQWTFFETALFCASSSGIHPKINVSWQHNTFHPRSIGRSILWGNYTHTKSGDRSDRNRNDLELFSLLWWALPVRNHLPAQQQPKPCTARVSIHGKWLDVFKLLPDWWWTTRKALWASFPGLWTYYCGPSDVAAVKEWTWHSTESTTFDWSSIIWIWLVDSHSTFNHARYPS